MESLGLYLTIGAFALHGLGMLVAGLTLPLAQRGGGGQGGFGHSWLLARLGGFEPVAGTVLWGPAGLGYLAAALGLLLGGAWWTLGAWLGAPLTVAAIALWFGSVPPGTYVGGVLAALTIGALLFERAG